MVVFFSSLRGQDTFSIVAGDETTGEVGSAGASCVDLTGSGMPGGFIGELLPGLGAINTQAYYLATNQANARYRMLQGDTPSQIISWLIANDAGSDPTIRQYGIIGFVNDTIESAAHTGVNTDDFKNHVLGPNYAIQGNILLGQQILDSMESRFLAEPGDLACKLMAALQGAKVLGADTRCASNGTSALFAYVKVAQLTDNFGSPSFTISVETASGAGIEPIDSLQVLFEMNHPACDPTWYEDNDGDGFGNPAITLTAATQPAGYVADNTDCNDADGTVYPGAPELCDGQVNDCSGGNLPSDEIDNDQDGYVECALDAGGWDGSPSVIGGDDCHDGDTTVYPGAPELCDGQVNDCSGGNLPSDEIDNDQDGYVECALDAGGWDGSPSVIGGDDCHDGDMTVYPGAIELCDGQVNDCAAGSLPPDEVDDDQDGYVECLIDSGGWNGNASVTGGGDCNDTDMTVYPGANELCDGFDNNCDTVIDEGCTLPECDGDVLFINSLTQDTFYAEISITSDALVNSPSSVLFSAGDSIVLQSPFEVTLGTEFLAEIGPCTLSVPVDGSNTPENSVKLNRGLNDLIQKYPTDYTFDVENINSHSKERILHRASREKLMLYYKSFLKTARNLQFKISVYDGKGRFVKNIFIVFGQGQ